MGEKKWSRKDYLLVLRDLLEDLLYEQPDISDYLPQLMDWCNIEIKKVDSQREMQRVKRMITLSDQDWDAILSAVDVFLDKNRGKFFLPKTIHEVIKQKYVITEEQLSYRLRQGWANGIYVRKKIPSERSANLVWGYALPQEVKKDG